MVEDKLLTDLSEHALSDQPLRSHVAKPPPPPCPPTSLEVLWSYLTQPLPEKQHLLTRDQMSVSHVSVFADVSAREHFPLMYVFLWLAEGGEGGGGVIEGGHTGHWY